MTTTGPGAVPGPPRVGLWLHIPDTFATEICAAAEFDWYCVDLQHGMATESDVLGMVRVAGARGAQVFVRVAGVDPVAVGRVLDFGADGVIVPMVESATDARAVGRACRYPPAGRRSWGPTRRKLSGQPSAAAENSRVVCLDMIETAAGVAAQEEILGVPEVDGVFVGPADLALDLGDRSSAEQAIDSIVATSTALGKVVGVFGGGAGRTADWVRRGFHFVAADSDSTLLLQAVRDTVGAARGREPRPDAAHRSGRS